MIFPDRVLELQREGPKIGSTGHVTKQNKITLMIKTDKI